MSDFLTRNRLALAKIETTSGTDATPVPATDAVLVEEPRGTPNMELEQTDEVTGSLDHSQSIVGGGYLQHTARFFAKGSGTPGTAPESAPYLRAAAMAETTLAADESDTAQAGAASTITLAAGAASSDLTGFVIATTGGTGSGQTRVITAYDTGTKVAAVYPAWDTVPDATTTYTVYAGVLYVPASAALETLTHYLYKKNSGSGNAILEALVGAAVDLSFAVQTRQTGKFTATLRGKLQAGTSVANPTGAVFDATRPRPLRDADAVLGGNPVCFRNFTLDWGNQIVQGDCPGETFGYEAARVVDRRLSGRINPKLVTLASRDAFADLIAGTTQKLWLNWGETAGNRVSMYLPAIAYTGKEDDDLDGISADGLPFEATGIDSGVFLLFY
ncbi:hypothetical protein [Novosphingobium mangrovi (ex Huang et al. 2023)]|uniref:Phage tail protein n=1 Tax=Novosphingobium mangrovi (ex Huang et al. 2023) TaxID=2976432 RepID=A0ABT2I145_9SPHN|nr:hypothetical protein [Novosphingobium mangrovi (ex Huang et al. 2023)]MCT2398528.1 hypothetical protein [Novosphingobium mangrovi (ex Huang et al. 2023)]